MAKKRGNGDGSICRTKSGQWLAVLSVRGLDGKRKRITRYAKSKGHARIKLEELRTKMRHPAAATPSATVKEFLLSWLENTIKPNRAAGTHQSYRYAVENHIAPELGHILLADVSAVDVDQWLGKIADSVGSRTRQNAYAVLHAALQYAVRLGTIGENPCSRIDRPASDREPINPFSLAEAQKIIRESVSHRLHALIVLALTSGARQGELFGIRWSDINWDERAIRIQRQVAEVAGRIQVSPPKTAAGIRTINITPEAVEALRTRRAASLTEGRAGTAEVFTSRNGGLIRRSNFGNRQWKPLLKKLGLEHRGFHHCRHTAATLMLQARVPLHVVSRILGHSKPSVTLDIYSHYVDADGSQAAAEMSRMFRPSG